MYLHMRTECFAMITFDSVMEKYFKANPCQLVPIHVFCMLEKYLLFLMDIGTDINIYTMP